MAGLETSVGRSSSGYLLATVRRSVRWLTAPHVVLSLIMLVVMYCMVIIPLYRMVETTVTWQPRDAINIPSAEVGKFTLFHYMRMLTRRFGEDLFTYAARTFPHCGCRRDHSRSCHWRSVGMAGRANRYARSINRQSVGVDPLHYAILDAGAGLACIFQKHKFFGGHARAL